MKAINITAYTEDPSQIEAIKAVIKAFKIKYSISKAKEMDSPYNPDFVATIKKGDKQLAEGKGIKMSISDFKDLCK
jgi:hypothetical protein